MRALLVLIMVLTLSANAQAALSLVASSTIIVSSPITVGVSSSDSALWTGYFVLSESTYYWTDPVAADYVPPWTIYPAAGNMAYANPVSGYPAAYELAAVGTTPLQPGLQFSIDVIGVQVGTIYISLQNTMTYDEMSTNGPLPIVVVPEPATIALLGFGGLFLCRRK